MPLKPFNRRTSSSDELNRIQSDLESAINPISKKEILDGVLVTSTVGTSATSVAHGLQRTPRGWFVVSGQNNIDVSSAADDKFLYVIASGSSETVTFWVF